MRKQKALYGELLRLKSLVRELFPPIPVLLLLRGSCFGWG